MPYGEKGALARESTSIRKSLVIRNVEKAKSEVLVGGRCRKYSRKLLSIFRWRFVRQYRAPSVKVVATDGVLGLWAFVGRDGRSHPRAVLAFSTAESVKIEDLVPCSICEQLTAGMRLQFLSSPPLPMQPCTLTSIHFKVSILHFASSRWLRALDALVFSWVYLQSKYCFDIFVRRGGAQKRGWDWIGLPFRDILTLSLVPAYTPCRSVRLTSYVIKM